MKGIENKAQRERKKNLGTNIVNIREKKGKRSLLEIKVKEMDFHRNYSLVPYVPTQLGYPLILDQYLIHRTSNLKWGKYNFSKK